MKCETCKVDTIAATRADTGEPIVLDAEPSNDGIWQATGCSPEEMIARPRAHDFLPGFTEHDCEAASP